MMAAVTAIRAVAVTGGLAFRSTGSLEAREVISMLPMQPADLDGRPR